MRLSRARRKVPQFHSVITRRRKFIPSISLVIFLSPFVNSVATQQKSPGVIDRYSSLDSAFAICMGDSPAYLNRAFNGDLKEAVMKKGIHDTILTDEFDRVAKIIKQQNECLASMRKAFPEGLLKEWYFQKRLENSATFAFLNQMFDGESGELTTDDAPFREPVRRRFEEGLNRASRYLRIYHNAHIRYIRLRFPHAKPMLLSTPLHLCNSRGGFHQFFCNNDCPSSIRASSRNEPTILTSTRSLKAAIRASVFFNLLTDADDQKSSTENANQGVQAKPDRKSVDRKDEEKDTKNLEEMKKELQKTILSSSGMYKRLLELIKQRDVRNICKEIILDKDGSYFVCSDWNIEDKQLRVAIERTYDERDTRYFYNNFILFLLAHEQGHAVLHKGLLCGRSAIDRAEKKRIELEADKYASYLLDFIYRDFQSTSPVFQPVTFVAAQYLLEIAYPFEIFEYDPTYPTLDERSSVISQASMEEELDKHAREKIGKRLTKAERLAYERALAETFFEALPKLFEENFLNPSQEPPTYRYPVDIFNFHPVPFMLRGPATTIQH